MPINDDTEQVIQDIRRDYRLGGYRGNNDCEIRCIDPKSDRGVKLVHVSSEEECLQNVLKFEKQGRYNVYICLNPRTSEGTQSRDVTSVARVLVDIDPIRASGYDHFEATDEEKKCAYRLLQKVCAYLDIGEISYSTKDSANGYQIEIPVSVKIEGTSLAREIVGQNVKAFLSRIAAICREEGAEIDLAVHDLPRLMKVAGTTSHKNAAEGRPHRRAFFLKYSDRVESLSSAGNVQLETQLTDGVVTNRIVPECVVGLLSESVPKNYRCRKEIEAEGHVQTLTFCILGCLAELYDDSYDELIVNESAPIYIVGTAASHRPYELSRTTSELRKRLENTRMRMKDGKNIYGKTMLVEFLKAHGFNADPVIQWLQLSASKKTENKRLVSGGSGFQYERIARISRGLGCYSAFFDARKSSLTVDHIAAMVNFIAIEAPGAPVNRMRLYSFDRFFVHNGPARVSSELERIRRAMKERSTFIHRRYDNYVRSEIAAQVKKLFELKKKVTDNAGKDEMEKIKREVKALEFFLDLPGPLEITQRFRQEICDTLTARSLVQPSELNRAPRNGLFRVALKDCTLEGYLADDRLHVRCVPFSPEHRITRCLSACFLKCCAEEAKEWWQFSSGVFGVEGALRFYEHAGYCLISSYPLPTERIIHVIVGDPGTGKGTHAAAIERLLTFGMETYYTHATPQDLSDSQNRFSRQSLRDKMLIIDGDIPHTRIGDYSRVTDFFGGESAKLEEKYRDPVIEVPTAKCLWFSTYPLHAIGSPGGVWRRLLITKTREVAVQDPSIKPRLLSPDHINGFFLNALIGLARLALNRWKFTGEETDECIQEEWSILSDSAGIWIGNFMEKSEEISEPVEKFYDIYAKWCGKKQCKPVGLKTFTKRLRENTEPIFLVERRRFENARKTVVDATIRMEDRPGESRETVKEAPMAWSYYISIAPVSFEGCPDPLGRSPTHVSEDIEKGGKEETKNEGTCKDKGSANGSGQGADSVLKSKIPSQNFQDSSFSDGRIPCPDLQKNFRLGTTEGRNNGVNSSIIGASGYGSGQSKEDRDGKKEGVMTLVNGTREALFERLCALLSSGAGNEKALSCLSSIGLHPNPKSSPNILARMCELHLPAKELAGLMAEIEEQNSRQSVQAQGTDTLYPHDDRIDDKFLRVLTSHRSKVEEEMAEYGVSSPFDLPQDVKKELVGKYLA